MFFFYYAISSMQVLGQSWASRCRFFIQSIDNNNDFDCFVNMNLSKYLKIIELIILGLLFPLTIVIFNLSQFILVFMDSWYLWLNKYFLYRKKIIIKNLFQINFKENRTYIWFIFN